MTRTVLFVCLALTVVGGTPSARADDKQVCYSIGTNDFKAPEYAKLGLAACERAIKSGAHKGKVLGGYYGQSADWKTRLNDLKGAMDDFDKAIELNKDNHEIFDFRGDLWVKMGNDERALSDYEHATRLKPTYAASYFSRGEIYRKRGDKTKAIAEYKKAIAQPPAERIQAWAQNSARDDVKEARRRTVKTERRCS